MVVVKRVEIGVEAAELVATEVVVAVVEVTVEVPEMVGQEAVVDIVTLKEMTDDQEVLHSDHQAKEEVKIKGVILATITEVMIETTEVAAVTDMLQTEEVTIERTEVVAVTDMLQTEVGIERT